MKSIKEIDIITTNPNFTIVLPIGCSADCSFCSWRTSNQDKQTYNDAKFIQSLVDTLENLPEECNQITISGGEPSAYKKLDEVMSVISYHKRKNIKKVVFTTNGQNLLELSNQKWFTSVVDYVNLSRHDSNQEDNDRIMGIKTIDWETIKMVSSLLGKEGIPLNINCVLSDSITTRYSDVFLMDFVDACRDNYVNSITFRKDYDDGFGIHVLETVMGKSSDVADCPVCRKSRYILKGMEVLFTTSEFEPTEILGDKVYEFILQPNADLTTDWEGNDVIDVLDSVEAIRKGRGTAPRPKKTKTTQNNGFGARFSSCGGRVSGC